MADQRPYGDGRSGSPAGGWQPLEHEASNPSGRWWLWALIVGSIVMIVVGGLTLLSYRLEPCLATVSRLDRGSLMVRQNALHDWEAVAKGQRLAQGVTLQSDPDTVAQVTFCDGSLLRVEAQGEWEIVESRKSRNGQLYRVTIAQRVGTASLVSRPLRERSDPWVRLQLPGAVAELAGVATFATAEGGATQIDVLQGRCRVSVSGKEEWVLVAGQRAVVE